MLGDLEAWRLGGFKASTLEVLKAWRLEGLEAWSWKFERLKMTS